VFEDDDADDDARSAISAPLAHKDLAHSMCGSGSSAASVAYSQTRDGSLWTFQPDFDVRLEPPSHTLAFAPPTTSECASAGAGAWTTVGLQHVGYSHTRKHLPCMADMWLSRTVDAIYAPKNRKNGTHLGYTFVNFTSVEYAVESIRRFDGYFVTALRTERACRAAYAKRQCTDFPSYCQEAIWTSADAPRLVAIAHAIYHASSVQVWGRGPTRV